MVNPLRERIITIDVVTSDKDDCIEDDKRTGTGLRHFRIIDPKIPLVRRFCRAAKITCACGYRHKVI